LLLFLLSFVGSKEDAETVTAFFEDMKRRGLNDPLLVTSDGAPGYHQGDRSLLSTRGPTAAAWRIVCATWR
jgi:hypothetical protein